MISMPWAGTSGGLLKTNLRHTGLDTMTQVGKFINKTLSTNAKWNHTLLYTVSVDLIVHGGPGEGSEFTENPMSLLVGK
jgi:hypothetical protein